MNDLQNMIIDDEHVEMLPARTQLTLLGLSGSSHSDSSHESSSHEETSFSQTTTYSHESDSSSSDTSSSHGDYGVQYGHGSGHGGDDNSTTSTTTTNNGVGGTGGGINVAALNGTLNGLNILGGNSN